MLEMKWKEKDKDGCLDYEQRITYRFDDFNLLRSSHFYALVSSVWPWMYRREAEKVGQLDTNRFH